MFGMNKADKEVKDPGAPAGTGIGNMPNDMPTTAPENINEASAEPMFTFSLAEYTEWKNAGTNTGIVLDFTEWLMRKRGI